MSCAYLFTAYIILKYHVIKIIFNHSKGHETTEGIKHLCHRPLYLLFLVVEKADPEFKQVKIRPQYFSKVIFWGPFSLFTELLNTTYK